jgi:hypothetical protein
MTLSGGNRNMAVTVEMKKKWKQHAIESQQKAHDMIHDIGVNYIKNPEQIAEMLEFGSRFYRYSLNNMYNHLKHGKRWMLL